MTGTVSRPTVTTPSIGQPIRRKEDARLLTGATNWTDKIQLPGALHLQIARSPIGYRRHLARVLSRMAVMNTTDIG